jgi:antitoxin component YwqK of YwqJK toxin-antitoxin module
MGRLETLKSAKFKIYLKIFCILLSLVWIAGCIFWELIVDDQWLGYEVFGFFYLLNEETNDFLFNNLWFSSKWEAGIVGLFLIWFPFFLISMMLGDKRTLETLESGKNKTNLKIFFIVLSVVWVAVCILGKPYLDGYSWIYEVFGFQYNYSRWEANIIGLLLIWFLFFIIRISMDSDDNFISEFSGKNITNYKEGQKEELETSQVKSVVEENQKLVSKYDLKQEEGRTLFKDKYFTGESVSYHPNESKKSEHFYQDGIIILSKEWNDDGSLKTEVKYVDGEKVIDENRTELLKDGNTSCKIQFKDGKKHSEENYIEGTLNGRSTYWHPNGKKKVEKNYKNGKENGIRKEWNEDGKKTYEANFVDGNEE